MNSLKLYIRKFQKLRTAKYKGAEAPHKPILLLAVIKNFDKGNILSNRICITPELVANFKDLWHQLVSNPGFTENFSLPFYHLKSDGFWHIHTIIGREILLTSSFSIRSFSHLKQVVDFVSLEDDLFELIVNKKSRFILQQTLLSRYFPNSPSISDDNKLVQQVINQILNDPPEVYKSKSELFDEEEVFIRGGVFKREIPRIYNYTCCITGMRIIADRQVQMIDACHIVPFSESGDDTIGNGISLCPNMHRAFDRGLLSISDDYKVIIKDFHEADAGYSIKQFAGRQIMLPAEEKYHPLRENLYVHRNKFGFV